MNLDFGQSGLGGWPSGSPPDERRASPPSSPESGDLPVCPKSSGIHCASQMWRWTLGWDLAVPLLGIRWEISGSPPSRVLSRLTGKP